MVEPLLTLRGVEKEFPVRGTGGKLSLRAVNNLSLKIFPGETVGLVGESGCGKSTLGYLIMNLLEMTKGEIIFEGHSVAKMSKSERRALRPQIQIVFQDPQSSLNPRFRVEQIVEEPLRLNGWRDRQKRRERVIQLLQKVGLAEEHLKRFPHEFSGGQRQRIAIARALSLNPKLIVLDEPTSALDVSVQAQVLNLLKDLQKEFNLSYLFISHNLAVVRHLSDRVGVMYLGSIVELAQSEELFANPLHPYTKTLMQSIPNVEDDKPLVGELNDEMPSPLHLPSGCSFHPRCSQTTQLCRQTKPELSVVKDGHWVACHHCGIGKMDEGDV